MLALLKRLRDEYQLAIVLITHEMDAVRTAADAVAEIRDGTIVQYGRIEDLLARPDSLLGQQLLPLTPAAATHSDLLLRLSYRWDVPVATDWISRLSQQWALQIDLLGGHVEVINGRLAGRLQAGVRFQGERLSPARLQGLLAQLGITAEILDSTPLLRRRYETDSHQSGYPWGEIPSLLLPAYGETWLMVAIVMLFVVTLGGLVGVVLFNASPRGLFPHALLYRLLNWVVNMGRSLPFLVLMAAIIPFTYWLTGTTIGIPAAVVPMIAAGVRSLAVWWRTRCASCRRRSPRWGSSAAGRAGKSLPARSSVKPCPRWWRR